MADRRVLFVALHHNPLDFDNPLDSSGIARLARGLTFCATGGFQTQRDPNDRPSRITPARSA